MPTYRKLALGLGIALAAASVSIAGTMSASASPAPQPVANHPATTDSPDPNAPHVGFVRGAQYGSHISLRDAQTVHSFRVVHRDLIAGARARGASGDNITTIHPSDGTSFNVGDVGEQATQSVSTKIKVGNAGTTLYTPTTYPSAGGTPGSCVEVSTVYTQRVQEIGAWDWCVAINFVAQVPIDKSFMRTYTKHHFYSTQIVQTDAGNNTWTAYLYNYKTKQWQTFFSQHGASAISPGYQGWDVYELYSELDGQGQSYACADLEGKRVAAKNILVGVNGNLVRADDTNAGQAYDHPAGDFHCDSFSYNMIDRLYHWKAIG